jgi:hypothetical protein
VYRPALIVGNEFSAVNDQSIKVSLDFGSL